MQKPDQEILVSVVVITYNSAKYVLETLESIESQIYGRIEVVISDDASSDETLNICRGWMNKAKNRFEDIKLVVSPLNTGPAANCNRGIVESNGEWVKLIAGDDVLLPNCLSDYMNFVSQKPDIYFAFSKGIKIDEHSNKTGTVGEFKPQFDLDAKGQFKATLISPFVFSPSVFIRKSVFSQIGLYNEEASMIEDYPMWLKATKNGFRFFYMPEATVKYRIHSSSITSGFTFDISSKTYSMNPRKLETLLEIFNHEYSNDLWQAGFYNLYFQSVVKRRALKMALGKKLMMFRLLVTVLAVFGKVKSMKL